MPSFVSLRRRAFAIEASPARLRLARPVQRLAEDHPSELLGFARGLRRRPFAPQPSPTEAPRDRFIPGLRFRGTPHLRPSSEGGSANRGARGLLTRKGDLGPKTKKKGKRVRADTTTNRNEAHGLVDREKCFVRATVETILGTLYVVIEAPWTRLPECLHQS